MSWIRETVAAQNVDDLRTSYRETLSQLRDAGRQDHNGFEEDLDTHTSYKRKVYLQEQQAQEDDRFLRGRQIAHMIYEHFCIAGSSELFRNSLISWALLA